MAKNIPRTYRSKRPLKIILTILLSLVIVFVVLMVSLFFGLRKYVVYPTDPSGSLYLDIPWLTEESYDGTSPSP